MSDLIDREDAIDAINAYLGLSAVSRTIQNMTSIQGILENLPSAEPKINHCKDCKFCEKDEIFGGSWCRGYRVRDDHFCGYASRREGEKDA